MTLTDLVYYAQHSTAPLASIARVSIGQCSTGIRHHSPEFPRTQRNCCPADSTEGRRVGQTDRINFLKVSNFRNQQPADGPGNSPLGRRVSADRSDNLCRRLAQILGYFRVPNRRLLADRIDSPNVERALCTRVWAPSSKAPRCTTRRKE